MKFEHFLFRLSLPFRRKRAYAPFEKKRIQVISQDADRIVFRVDGCLSFSCPFPAFKSMVQNTCREGLYDVLLHKIAVSLNRAGVDIDNATHVRLHIESQEYHH